MEKGSTILPAVRIFFSSEQYEVDHLDCSSQNLPPHHRRVDHRRQSIGLLNMKQICDNYCPEERTSLLWLPADPKSIRTGVQGSPEWLFVKRKRSGKGRTCRSKSQAGSGAAGKCQQNSGAFKCFCDFVPPLVTHRPIPRRLELRL